MKAEAPLRTKIPNSSAQVSTKLNLSSKRLGGNESIASSSKAGDSSNRLKEHKSPTLEVIAGRPAWGKHQVKAWEVEEKKRLEQE